MPPDTPATPTITPEQQQGCDSRTPQERAAVEAHMAAYDERRLYTSPAGHFLAGYRARDAEVAMFRESLRKLEQAASVIEPDDELSLALDIARAALTADPRKQADAPQQITDEEIRALLDDLDGIARHFDHYEYGLPLHDEDCQSKMIEAVRALLAAPTAGPDPHSCSYFCERPACIKAQRDELREQRDDAKERFDR